MITMLDVCKGKGLYSDGLNAFCVTWGLKMSVQELCRCPHMQKYGLLEGAYTSLSYRSNWRMSVFRLGGLKSLLIFKISGGASILEKSETPRHYYILARDWIISLSWSPIYGIILYCNVNMFL